MNTIKLYCDKDHELSLSAQSENSQAQRHPQTNPAFLVEVDANGLKEIIDKAPHAIRQINRLD